MWLFLALIVSVATLALSTISARSQTTIAFCDDFERPDGALGGGWQITGAALPFIDRGTMAITRPGAGYAFRTFAQQPRMIGGSVVFAPGDGPPAQLALILSSDSTLTLQRMLHFAATSDRWYLQVTDTGPANLRRLASGILSAIPRDGTPVHYALLVDGSTVTVLLPDGSSRSVTDPRVAAISGPLAVWELLGAEGDDTARWEMVYAADGPVYDSTCSS